MGVQYSLCRLGMPRLVRTDGNANVFLTGRHLQRLTGVQYPLCQTGKPRLVDGRKKQCFPDREALAASDGSSIPTVSDG